MSGDRWILEGLASWAAGQVSTELELALPYDPAAVAEDLADDAFPLAEWTADERSPAGRRLGLRRGVGPHQPGRRAGRHRGLPGWPSLRMAAGLDGYDRSSEDAPGLSGEPATITSRAYLDHLDAVTEAPVVETLAGPVLGEAAAAELPPGPRPAPPTRLLRRRAGDWGDPDPVRAALVEWRFDDAETRDRRRRGVAHRSATRCWPRSARPA